jgi:hypothetical protein
MKRKEGVKQVKGIGKKKTGPIKTLLYTTISELVKNYDGASRQRNNECRHM